MGLSEPQPTELELLLQKWRSAQAQLSPEQGEVLLSPTPEGEAPDKGEEVMEVPTNPPESSSGAGKQLSCPRLDKAVPVLFS
ncbi:UNVERIFIED_CONTAM: hypothetical protein FKN15_019580 [Acipenser sinensis]